MKILISILFLVLTAFAQKVTYNAYNCVSQTNLPNGYVVVCQKDGSTGFIREYVNYEAVGHEYQYYPRSMGGGIFADIYWHNGEYRQIKGYYPNGNIYYVIDIVNGNRFVRLSYTNTDDLFSEIIAQSISEYTGNCPCPYNTDARGYRCGGRSAYSRAGGYAPICYDSDITGKDIEKHRQYILKIWNLN